MSTIRANAILDSAGGNTATINGITPTDTAGVLSTFNASGSAPVYACRAWARFDGRTTVTINGSGNVSSIVRNSAGNYTINFSAAMPDTNFVVLGITGAYNFNVGFGTTAAGTFTRTTTSVTFVIGNGDQADINIAIFR